jgi:hypothetical protein
MGRAIQFNGEEGEIFMKWMESRLIRQNKNVLGAELGATGSGKSYRDLRKAELWYRRYFKEDFPEENICFGVGAVMRLLSSGKLRRGEIIIFEEAGANMGSLDFQTRISKMFAYTLQSFRSMNIAIFFNLPFLSMLNNQARQLLHYSAESKGVDRKLKTNRCKLFFHQVAQRSGKIYPKYPVVKINGKTRQIKRVTYSEPAAYLIEAYEKKKAAYLKDLTTNFADEIDKIENNKKNKIEIPKDWEFEAYNMSLLSGPNKLTQTEIGEKWNLTQAAISYAIKKVKKYKDYTYKSYKNTKETPFLEIINENTPTPHLNG